jgi:hypothetical protein
MMGRVYLSSMYPYTEVLIMAPAILSSSGMTVRLRTHDPIETAR